jgi:flagellar hook protein FlgE
MSNSFAISQTGLQGVETEMQAVSNNLANASTTGYKSEDVDFATLLGEFIDGNALGGGVVQTAVNTDFSEGSVVQSNSPTDLAIQGNGFFILKDSSGMVDYARDGHMTVGSNGTLLAYNGQSVMGFGVNAAGTANGVLAPIVIPQAELAPTASANVAVAGNLDAGSVPIAGAINPSNPSTYNASQSVQVYDSLGNAHTFTVFLQNAGPVAGGNDQWNWAVTLDGSTTGLTNNTGSFQFNSAGAIVSGSVPANPVDATVAGAKPLALNLNFAQLTQFGSGNSLSATADGNAVGLPGSVQVSNTGLVSVAYSNGQSVNVAQVALATFPAQEGLLLGNDGVYQQTEASGAPVIGVPGSGSAGSIQAGALENSNVDVTSQLVNLVTLQNNFQANAKALQTEGNIENTLFSLSIA